MSYNLYVVDLEDAEKWMLAGGRGRFDHGGKAGFVLDETGTPADASVKPVKVASLREAREKMSAPAKKKPAKKKAAKKKAD
jgi:hypothetical protein